MHRQRPKRVAEIQTPFFWFALLFLYFSFVFAFAVIRIRFSKY